MEWFGGWSGRLMKVLDWGQELNWSSPFSRSNLSVVFVLMRWWECKSIYWMKDSEWNRIKLRRVGWVGRRRIWDLGGLFILSSSWPSPKMSGSDFGSFGLDFLSNGDLWFHYLGWVLFIKSFRANLEEVKGRERVNVWLSSHSLFLLSQIQLFSHF